MSETRAFHLGTLLTATHGKMVSPDHLGGVSGLVTYVTGKPHLTHQLPRASYVVKAVLLEQLPWLADVAVPAGLGSKDEVLAWLVGATEQYGAMHEVQALPPGTYVGRDLMAEALELKPNARFLPATVDAR